MANIVNIDAETQADIIGDDAQPTLTLDNTSTGSSLLARTLAVSSGASIEQAEFVSGSATKQAAVFTQTVVGNMSIGLAKFVGNSVASGAVLEFSNKAFASITSVVLTTVANTDYAIRVQVGAETRWIPVFKDAAIIGAAAFS